MLTSHTEQPKYQCFQKKMEFISANCILNVIKYEPRPSKSRTNYQVTQGGGWIVGGGCLCATEELFSDHHVFHLVGFHLWFCHLCPIAFVFGELQMALSVALHRFLGWHHFYWLKISVATDNSHNADDVLGLNASTRKKPHSWAMSLSTRDFVTMCRKSNPHFLVSKCIDLNIIFNRAEQEHWFRLQKS